MWCNRSNQFPILPILKTDYTTIKKRIIEYIGIRKMKLWSDVVSNDFGKMFDQLLFVFFRVDDSFASFLCKILSFLFWKSQDLLFLSFDQETKLKKIIMSFSFENSFLLEIILAIMKMQLNKPSLNLWGLKFIYI